MMLAHSHGFHCKKANRRMKETQKDKKKFHWELIKESEMAAINPDLLSMSEELLVLLFKPCSTAKDSSCLHDWSMPLMARTYRFRAGRLVK